MAKIKTKTIVAILAAAAIAVALALAFALSRRGGEAPAPVEKPAPAEEPYVRIKDPEYVAKLNAQRDEMHAIMRRIDATRREIAALGGDTNSEKYVSLTNRLAAQAAEIEANRLKSEAIVREHILRETGKGKQGK